MWPSMLSFGYTLTAARLVATAVSNGGQERSDALRTRPNFAAEHIQLLKGLDYADIMGVADYLARS
jgi:hypothetical protein